MDVDEEEGGQAGGDTEEDEPSRMSVDGDEGGDSTSKKASKLKPRKSQLNVEALRQEQAILATYNENELTELRLKKKHYSDALNFIDGIETAMELTRLDE